MDLRSLWHSRGYDLYRRMARYTHLVTIRSALWTPGTWRLLSKMGRDYRKSGMPVLWTTGTTGYKRLLFALYPVWPSHLSISVTLKKRTHTPHPLTSQIVNGDIFHRCFQDVYAVSGMLYNDNRSLMPTERNEHIVYSERYSLPVLRYGEFHLESVHEGNEWCNFLSWVLWNHSDQMDNDRVFLLQKKMTSCLIPKTMTWE